MQREKPEKFCKTRQRKIKAAHHSAVGREALRLLRAACGAGAGRHGWRGLQLLKRSDNPAAQQAAFKDAAEDCAAHTATTHAACTRTGTSGLT